MSMPGSRSLQNMALPAPLAVHSTLPEMHAVRQLAKPMASQIKTQAINHPTFRGIILGFAQRWHRLQMQIQIRFQGHVPKDIKVLNCKSETQLYLFVFCNQY